MSSWTCWLMWRLVTARLAAAVSLPRPTSALVNPSTSMQSSYLPGPRVGVIMQAPHVLVTARIALSLWDEQAGTTVFARA